jgi:hypothetical protein
LRRETPGMESHKSARIGSKTAIIDPHLPVVVAVIA